MDELNKIIDSFNSEVHNIKEYIEFLEESSMSNVFNRDCITNIYDVFERIEELRLKNCVEIELRESELSVINLIQMPREYEEFVKSEIGESIIDLIFFGINKVKTTENKEIIKSIKVELQTLIEVESRFDNTGTLLELEDNLDKLNEYIDLAKIIYNQKRYYINKKEIKILKNYNRALSLIDTTKNINIYRQSFIQLVSLFDSTLFDAIRLKFQNDFFNWIGDFSEGSLKYKDISKFNDMEEFTYSIVDDKLKSSSLKDLIKIIKDKNKDLFNINDKNRYSEFVEIICRRNSHIHNNGIVDNGYITGCNLENKSLGNYLEIDKEYFEKVLLYFTYIIENIGKI